jgi:hypothetical protein
VATLIDIGQVAGPTGAGQLNRSQSLGKISHSIKPGLDDEFPGLIDIIAFFFNIHGCQAFGKIVGTIKIKRDEEPTALF